MNILVRATKNRFDELNQKLSESGHTLHWLDDNDLISPQLNGYELIMDLNFDEKSNQLHLYAGFSGLPVIVGSVKQSLAKAYHDFGRKLNCLLIGMNTLPSFIHRSVAEVSLLHSEDSDKAQAIINALGWKMILCDDRVGMVTPRVICMIINEACFTLQEGTAGMRDIDTSMKLGTNYPFGPFEWADRIGIKHVYETLEAVYQDTHDERYKACPLLKTYYLKGESFYPTQA